MVVAPAGVAGDATGRGVGAPRRGLAGGEGVVVCDGDHRARPRQGQPRVGTAIRGRTQITHVGREARRQPAAPPPVEGHALGRDARDAHRRRAVGEGEVLESLFERGGRAMARRALRGGGPPEANTGPHGSLLRAAGAPRQRGRPLDAGPGEPMCPGRRAPSRPPRPAPRRAPRPLLRRIRVRFAGAPRRPQPRPRRRLHVLRPRHRQGHRRRLPRRARARGHRDAEPPRPERRMRDDRRQRPTPTPTAGRPLPGAAHRRQHGPRLRARSWWPPSR